MSIETNKIQTVANDICVAQGELVLPEPLSLHFGGELHPVQIAWRLEGAAHRPVVLVLGGISASRYVVATTDPLAPAGWWKQVMGPGLALDTHHYQVLGIDFIGGSGASTAPVRGQKDFPSISAFDQVAVIKHLLQHLNIAQLHAVIGASYGAMVALAIGQVNPELVQRLIVVSGAHRTHPMSTAWRSVQRAMVRYAIAHNEGSEGLRLARALAMATYRSSDEFAQRFSGEPARTTDGFVFPVEQYLFSRGEAYAANYVPESFVCLSESIDLHRVDPEKIEVPTTLVAVQEDQLVPFGDMQELHDAMGGPARLVALSSIYGHDAFLKEAEAMHDIFIQALK